jgi:exportin-T
MSSDENDQSADSIFNSQLYLYEAIGCICSTSAVPVDKQVFYVQSIMNSFADLEAHLDPARNGDERAKLQIHHIVMALGTLARGFSDWSPGNTSSSSSAPAKEISRSLRGQLKLYWRHWNLELVLLMFAPQRRLLSRDYSAFSVPVYYPSSQMDQWASQSSTKDEMAMFLRLLICCFWLQDGDLSNPRYTAHAILAVFVGISNRLPALTTKSSLRN